MKKMYKCRRCEREFTTVQGKEKHERYCADNEIGLDNGYEYIIGKDGRVVYVHRQVMEKKLGRLLEKDEVVHHIDENKRNNDPCNLDLTNRSSHGKHHYKGIPKNTNPVKGSKHGLTKLTEENVKDIKEKLKLGIHENVLSKRYNVSFDTIWDIKKDRTWKHVLI